MSNHEIYAPTEKVEDIERAAEFTAVSIYDNLRRYQRGERGEFIAIFPVNIAGTDDKGRPNGVNDIAHNKFLEMLVFDDITDEYIVLSSGTKLYFREDRFMNDAGEMIPYQMTYGADPITVGLELTTADSV